MNLLTDSDVEKVAADGDRGQIVTERLTGHTPDVHTWSRTTDFDEFVQLCGCGHAHLRLLTDPDLLSTAHRGGCVGPAALSEVAVDADLAMDCGELCGSYRVFLCSRGPQNLYIGACPSRAVPGVRPCSRRRVLSRCAGIRVAR